jgi:pyroglutamyl-peptidase
MTHILLTGFEPFGKSSLNPSQILVEDAPAAFPNDVTISKAILPVEKTAGPQTLLSALQQHQPDAVICFGLAVGRPVISLERVAVNLMDYRMPDNAGETVLDHPIAPDGPAAYFSRLPLTKMHQALQDHHIPVEYSLSAGAYLCNQIFYTLMHYLDTHHRPIPAGFIHLPACPEQAAHFDKPLPTMSLDLMKSALPVLINTILIDTLG